jgi:hypothetical protein
VLSFAQIIVSVASIAMGFTFGVIARYGSAIWPLAIMLSVNVAALFAATLVRVSRTTVATA